MQFVIVGGGCYGTFYARQLLRAADANAIAAPEIVVVDHSDVPQVVREFSDARIRVVQQDWTDFFAEYFPAVSPESDDQIVPPPFTPHLALGWLLSALNEAGDRHWGIEPFRAAPVLPFVRQSDNGTLNLSHAGWICPVHCVEPEICPHTKADRWWDMADTAQEFAQTLARAGQPVSQVHLFQCLHFTHGVGTYPAAAVVRACNVLEGLKLGGNGVAYALVGTVSRCHGTMHLLKATSGTDTVSPTGGTAT